MADARRTLAVVLANDPARPAWEVIIDATRIADSIMRTTEQDIRDGAASGEQVDRLVESVRLAHSLASAAVTTRSYELAQQAKSTSVSSEISTHLVRAIDTVTAAIVTAVPGVRRSEWERWAAQACAAALVGDPVPTPPVLGPPVDHPQVLDSTHSANDGRGGALNGVLELTEMELPARTPAADSGPETSRPDGAVGVEPANVLPFPGGQPVTRREQENYVRSIGRNRSGMASVIYDPHRPD